MSGVFFIILACFLWAFDALIRYPLVGQGITPIQIVFIEHALLTIIFIPILFKLRAKIWKAQISHLFYFLIVGGMGSAIATLAFTKAFTFLNPSLVIILQKFQPVVAILLARLFLGEMIQKKFIFWALVCLVGGFCISFSDLFEQIPKAFSRGDLFGETALMGYFLVMISVGGWGAATVFGKKLSTCGYDHKEIMCGRFIFGFFSLLPIFLASNQSLELAPINYGKISAMVMISGLCAMYCYYVGLQKISARASALAEMFFPFAAVVVNWIFLGSVLAPSQLVGGALLLLGSTVIQYKRY